MKLSFADAFLRGAALVSVIGAYPMFNALQNGAPWISVSAGLLTAAVVLGFVYWLGSRIRERITARRAR